MGSGKSEISGSSMAHELQNKKRKDNNKTFGLLDIRLWLGLSDELAQVAHSPKRHLPTADGKGTRKRIQRPKKTTH